jgi:hypothetical protein
MLGSANKSEPEAGSVKQVGYRNPSAATQFKKGQSGNPKGRPKGSLNVSTVFAQMLRERVAFNENGRRKTMTKLEAVIKQIVNKAASGDLRAIKLLMSFEAETRAAQPQPNDQTPKKSDQKIVEGIMKRFRTSIDDQGRKQ